MDLALIRALGLPATVQRTHVGYMGCHGALNGLRVARAFTAAEPDARVLLCAVELCSLHYHYGWDPQKVIANALFADGAAAVVGVSDAAAPPEAWRVAATGSCLIPDSETAMTWTIGDHGFEMTLSKAVPRLIALHLRPWLEGWLHQHGVAVDRSAPGPSIPAGRASSTPWRRAWACRAAPRTYRGQCWPNTATCRRRRCCLSSNGCARPGRRGRAWPSASAPG